MVLVSVNREECKDNLLMGHQIFVFLCLIHLLRIERGNASRLGSTPACPDPPPIANSYRWITGDKVQYKCVESYNMTSGDGELTCETDGVWLGQSPVCDLYCGQPPESPGTLRPAQVTNDAMVNYNPDLEIAETIYTCKSNLVDSDASQDNKVVCDRGQGQWKAPANVFCLYESSLSYESWVLSMQSAGYYTVLNGLLDEAIASNDTLDIDIALLEYLNTSCFMMSNGPDDTAEFVIDLLPQGSDFELTSVELHLQTVHSNLECVKNSSQGLGVDYVGTRNYTETSLTCQAWAEMTPHNHGFTKANYFEDASFDDVNNYCRNPRDGGSYRKRPWCYTTDPNVEWDYCDIPVCHQFKLDVAVVNASDGGPDIECNYIEYYTAERGTNWTVECLQTSTGPFGTQLKLSLNASEPVFVCELRPRGVEYVSGCGEPPHQRGWKMVQFGGYALGNTANYTCAEGFHYRQGSKSAECTRGRFWVGPFLECSDETNLAYDGISSLRDNDLDWCVPVRAGVVVEVRLATMMEVTDVILTVLPVQVNGTLSTIEVNATIQDGTTRQFWDVTLTEEGFLATSLFRPITDHLTIQAAYDLRLCEVKVFGRNTSESLECVQQKSGGYDYKGRLNISRDGYECMPWTSHNRIDDFIFGDGDSAYVSNYCRNPYDKKSGTFFSGSRPVCFYQKEGGNVKWDYCEVFPCERACRLDREGFAYQGAISNTGVDSEAGQTCETWDSGEHRFRRKGDFPGASTNHAGCRNPGRSQERPWCITDSSTDPLTYAYCNIPECPRTSEIEWTVSVDLNNQSAIDDLYALTPLFRECICTDRKHQSYTEPQLFDQLAYQFCDSYAGEHKEILCHHIPSQAQAQLYGDGATWSRVFIICPPNPETIQPTLITEAPTRPVNSTTDTPTSTTDTPTSTTDTPATSTVDSSTDPEQTSISIVESTTEVTERATTEEESCPSRCSLTCYNTTLIKTTTEEEMQELLESNQRRMYVDTANLSKTKRKKISATDERPSSQATGAVAITILVFVVVFLMSGDIITVTGLLITIVKDCL